MNNFDFERWEDNVRRWFLSRLGEKLPKLEFVSVPDEIAEAVTIFRYIDLWANIRFSEELPFEIHKSAIQSAFSEKGISTKGYDLQGLVEEAIKEALEEQHRKYAQVMKFGSQFPSNTVFVLPSFKRVEGELRKAALIAHEGTHILQEANGLGKYVALSEGLAYAVQRAYSLQHGIYNASDDELAIMRTGYQESEQFRGYAYIARIWLTETAMALGIGNLRELEQANLTGLLSEAMCRRVEESVLKRSYKESIQEEMKR